MEPNPAAEDLPALYRAVLDRVATLEAAGQRELANHIRANAIKIYSRAWDQRAQHELEGLLRRHAARVPRRPMVWRGFRRRRTVRAA